MNQNSSHVSYCIMYHCLGFPNQHGWREKHTEMNQDLKEWVVQELGRWACFRQRSRLNMHDAWRCLPKVEGWHINGTSSDEEVRWNDYNSRNEREKREKVQPSNQVTFLCSPAYLVKPWRAEQQSAFLLHGKLTLGSMDKLNTVWTHRLGSCKRGATRWMTKSDGELMWDDQEDGGWGGVGMVPHWHLLDKSYTNLSGPFLFSRLVQC